MPRPLTITFLKTAYTAPDDYLSVIANRVAQSKGYSLEFLHEGENILLCVSAQRTVLQLPPPPDKTGTSDLNSASRLARGTGAWGEERISPFYSNGGGDVTWDQASSASFQAGGGIGGLLCLSPVP